VAESAVPGGLCVSLHLRRASVKVIWRLTRALACVALVRHFWPRPSTTDQGPESPQASLAPTSSTPIPGRSKRTDVIPPSRANRTLASCATGPPDSQMPLEGLQYRCRLLLLVTRAAGPVKLFNLQRPASSPALSTVQNRQPSTEQRAHDMLPSSIIIRMPSFIIAVAYRFPCACSVT